MKYWQCNLKQVVGTCMSLPILSKMENVPSINVGNITKIRRAVCMMDPVLEKLIGQLINALAGAIITYLVTVLRQKKQQIE